MNFLSATEGVMLSLFSVLCRWSFILLTDRLYHAEGHVEVKFYLLREAWLKPADKWSNGGSNVSRYARARSKKYETARTGAAGSGEDFQNTGTFTVVRSSVFALISEQSSPLARDAYNALWNSQRRGQVRNYSLVGSGKWLFEDS